MYEPNPLLPTSAHTAPILIRSAAVRAAYASLRDYTPLREPSPPRKSTPPLPSAPTSVTLHAPTDAELGLPSVAVAALSSIPLPHRPLAQTLATAKTAVLTQHDRDSAATALSHSLNLRRAESGARAVLIVTPTDVAARQWERILSATLTDVHVARAGNWSPVLRRLTSAFPGVIITNVRALRKDGTRLQQVLRDNVFVDRWELVVSDVCNAALLGADWMPLRMLADRQAERALLVVCKGEKPPKRPLTKDIVSTFLRNEVGSWQGDELWISNHFLHQLANKATTVSEPTRRELQFSYDACNAMKVDTCSAPSPPVLRKNSTRTGQITAPKRVPPPPSQFVFKQNPVYEKPAATAQPFRKDQPSRKKPTLRRSKHLVSTPRKTHSPPMLFSDEDSDETWLTPPCTPLSTSTERWMTPHTSVVPRTNSWSNGRKPASIVIPSVKKCRATDNHSTQLDRQNSSAQKVKRSLSFTGGTRRLEGKPLPSRRRHSLNGVSASRGHGKAVDTADGAKDITEAPRRQSVQSRNAFSASVGRALQLPEEKNVKKGESQRPNRRSRENEFQSSSRLSARGNGKEKKNCPVVLLDISDDDESPPVRMRTSGSFSQQSRSPVRTSQDLDEVIAVSSDEEVMKKKVVVKKRLTAPRQQHIHGSTVPPRRFPLSEKRSNEPRRKYTSEKSSRRDRSKTPPRKESGNLLGNDKVHDVDKPVLPVLTGIKLLSADASKLSHEERKLYNKLLRKARRNELRGVKGYPAAWRLYMKCLNLYDGDKTLPSRLLALSSASGAIRNSDFSGRALESPIKKRKSPLGRRHRNHCDKVIDLTESGVV